MPLVQVVILAVVQGLTEFLPISSSAHLALAPWLLGWKDQGLTFDIALHSGTLAAVLLYFFRDWLQVVAHGFGSPWGSDDQLRRNPRLLWFLAAATLPVGALGYVFRKQAEEEWRSPVLIGCMLIGVGILMLIAEKAGRRRKDIGQVSWLDSHHRGPVPRSGPPGRGALLLPPFHAGHRRRCAQGLLGLAQERGAHRFGAVPGGPDRQRPDRLPGHCLLPAVPSHPQP
jgi:hypothetical protein